MRKIFIALALIILSQIQGQTWTTDEQYIQKFAPYAVEEMEKFKIPASITLAQGLLETGAGQSRLAKEGNNHFGIKCKDEWTGRTMRHNDDAPNECFRVYDDVRQSYEDHSRFLAERKYYVNLFKLDIKDYKGWAHGLKKAGYATNPRYAQILLSIIEKHKLYEYDNTDSKTVYSALLNKYPSLQEDRTFLAQMNPGRKSASDSQAKTIKVRYEQTSYAAQQKKVQQQKNSDLLKEVLVKNHPNGGMKYLVVPADMDLLQIADKFGISESRLMKWNDLSSGKLKQNDIVFLESKSAEGNVPAYKAEVGEDMHAIAQKFGVRLDKLLAKNRMEDGGKLRAGDLVFLQGRKPR